MYPTFTGNSRRPRNVNLSGQKNVNPFAASSWGPSAAAGASKTVADAQAERRQRQQERERLKAAQEIQRTWRGHRTRRTLRHSRRQAFDEEYSSTSPSTAEARVLRVFPVLLSFFEPSSDDDCRRLFQFVQDLEQMTFRYITSRQSPPARVRHLFRIAIAAAERTGPNSTPTMVFVLLLEIIHSRPESSVNSLVPYYRLLAKCCQSGNMSEKTLKLFQAAVLAPLAPGGHSNITISEGYRAFAMSFLTSPLDIVETSTTPLADHVNLDALASAILGAFSSQESISKSRDELFWLLAHFIVLHHKAASRGSPLLLKALFTQVSYLSDDIRMRLPHGFKYSNELTQMPEDQSDLNLPRYVVDALRFLMDREEISALLGKFTLGQSGTSAHEFEDASLLAGYILTLIRCFPDHGDDLRMRLYLADVPYQVGKIPSVKFFWNAVSKTSVFTIILDSPAKTCSFLLQRNYFKPSAAFSEVSLWDREWRTLLLFLELYTFVLRLTDDEDFFAGLSLSAIQQNPSSRVRACALPLDDLKRLSRFLKNLAFTLHYHSAEILQDRVGGDKSAIALEDITTIVTKAESRDRDKSQSHAERTGTYSVVSGLNFASFKGIVTTAIRMLYERDSRRPFLPKDHWLMTSNFDMDGFLSAVVLEEQRQQELRESGKDRDEGSEDEDDEMDEDYRPIHTWAGHRRSQYARIERMRLQNKKANRERIRAMIGPKLEILRNMPYVIPFETRVQIFRQFVYLDKHRRRQGYIDPDQWRVHVIHQNGGPWNNNLGRDAIGRHHAKIRRGQLFTDAMDRFWELGEGLKEPIQITFVDQFGTVEAGIDGGGVTKEFLTSVTREAFTDEHNLFVANSHNALYPNPFAVDQKRASLEDAALAETDENWLAAMGDLLDSFEFLGRIVGKCLYEGILLDISFAGFFLLKWSSSATDTGYRASINDLREMDEELYQGMLQLKNYPGDVSDLSIDFTIADQVSLPGAPMVTKTRELIPNGADTPVTNENRPLYISYVARHRLVAQPYQQTRAFLRGLGSIIDPSWLSMFNQSELQRLVGGDSSEIDIDDLHRNTIYSGVYEIGDDGQEHPTIKLFWQVMRTLEDSERRDVLKYVTSTPRAPLLGFSQLSPRFSIRDGGGDQERLPSASTCVNLLKLPRYENAAQLRRKLLYAVSSGAGFDLS